MTASMVIAAVSAGGLLLARLARSFAPLLLTYLALRNSGPRHRPEILLALAPALRSLRPMTRLRRGDERSTVDNP